MSFQFATCDRRMALGFLVKLYPSHTVTDTEDCAKPNSGYPKNAERWQMNGSR